MRYRNERDHLLREVLENLYNWDYKALESDLINSPGLPYLNPQSRRRIHQDIDRLPIVAFEKEVEEFIANRI